MLDPAMKNQLRELLQRITAPVQIHTRLGEDPASVEIATLLRELTELSDRLSLHEETDTDAPVPSFALAAPGAAPRVRFAGVPMGHEFTSLVLALLQVGGYPPKADAALMEQARALPGEYRFETFISLSCQNCPDVVQALNLMAVLNPNVRHTMLDGALFQDAVTRRGVMAVPAVFLNGELFAQGRMSLAEILAKLDVNSAARSRAALSAEVPYDMLVIGAGPAGAAAAVYAARKGIRTGLLGERMGGQLLDTAGIENYVGLLHTEGSQLAANLEQHVRNYEVTPISAQRATALVPGALHEVRLANGAVLRARTVVLATGARWREMNVPGEKEYRNRGVAYCPHCDGPLFRGKPVAVIGGGNSGVEAAIDLAGIASHVTLLEFDAQLRADAVLTSKLRSLPNVTVLTNAQTLRVEGDGQRVTGLTYRDRAGGSEHSLVLAGIFVQIGLVPNTEWLKGTVKLSARGEIEIDARGQTSLPGVYAAGDCTIVPYKQIIVAAGEGAKAALGAFDHLIRTPVSRAA